MPTKEPQYYFLSPEQTGMGGFEVLAPRHLLALGWMETRYGFEQMPGLWPGLGMNNTAIRIGIPSAWDALANGRRGSGRCGILA